MNHFALLKLDLKEHLRSPADTLVPVLFFIMVLTLYPLAISPEANTLSRIAPGVIWISALLASLMSLNKLYLNDYENGTLALMLLNPSQLFSLVVAKTIAYWLSSCLPLIIVTPMMALALHVPTEIWTTLLLTLLLGTPVMSLVCGFCSALTLGLKRANVLVMIMILPLLVPVIILATSVINLKQTQVDPTSLLLIMVALFVFSLSVMPWLTQFALKLSHGE